MGADRGPNRHQKVQELDNKQNTNHQIEDSYRTDRIN